MTREQALIELKSIASWRQHSRNGEYYVSLLTSESESPLSKTEGLLAKWLPRWNGRG